MKIILEIPDKTIEWIREHLKSDAAILDAVKYGLKPTNGDIITAAFPDGKVFEDEDFILLYLFSNDEESFSLEFPKEWWDSTYMRGKII